MMNRQLHWRPCPAGCSSTFSVNLKKKDISRFWIIQSIRGFLKIISRFSQCWNQASDSGEEGEFIDELIDSVTDMKKAIVIQYLTPLPNYRVQIVKLPNP